MATKTKPTPQPNIRKRSAGELHFLKLTAKLAPLSDQAVAEFQAVKEKRDNYANDVKEKKEQLAQLQTSFEAETDLEKQSSLQQQISCESGEIACITQLIRGAEQEVSTQTII